MSSEQRATSDEKSPAGASVTVGVVIPCRNEEATIGQVLDALAAQDLRPDEVVVVDDGSTDRTKGEIERWRAGNGALAVQVMANPGRGTEAAVIAGIGTMSAEVIVRLDGHCKPASDYVRRLIALAASPDVGVSGGAWVIAPGDSTAVARAIALAAGHRFGSGGAAYRHPREGEPIDTDTVPFGCFRRQVWEAVGGYDESFGSNEDYEFNWRVRRSGLRVVLDPSVRCIYLARATLRDLARQYFRYGRWKATMLRGHPSALRLRQVAPAALVVVLAGAVVLTAARADLKWLLPVAGYMVALALAGLHAGVSGRSTSLRQDSGDRPQRQRRPKAAPTSAGGRFIGPLVSVAFAVMHVSWGLGFWVSMARSLAGRRG